MPKYIDLHAVLKDKINHLLKVQNTYIGKKKHKNIFTELLKGFTSILAVGDTVLHKHLKY